MTENLKAKLTDVGLAAATLADGTGVSLRITQIGLGSGVNGAGYVPTGVETSLASEQSRLQIASHSVVGPGQFVVSAIDDTGKMYEVHELGFYLEDQTLFAVYSDPVKMLAFKGVNDLIIDYDLTLTDAPDNVTVDSTGDIQLVYAEEFAIFGLALGQVFRHLIEGWLREQALLERISALIRQQAHSFNYLRYGPAERIELFYDSESRISRVEETVTGALRQNEFTYSTENRINTCVFTLPVLEIRETSTFFYDVAGRLKTIETTGVTQ